MHGLSVLLLLGFLASQAAVGSATTSDQLKLVQLLQQAQTANPAWRRAVPLLRLQQWQGFFAERQRRAYDELLANLRKDQRLPISLRRLATELEAQRLLGRGKEKLARQAWSRLGRLRNWWLAEGPGEDGQLYWRQLAKISENGLLALARLLPPRPRSAVWLATTVRFAKADRALLWSGCEPGCSIWLDGNLLLHQRGLNIHSFDQQAVRTRVPAGPSLILVRLERQNDNPQFSLAITDMQGRQIGQPAGQAPPVMTPPALRDTSPPTVRGAPLSLPQWFSRRARRQPEQVQALAEAAYVLSRLGGHDSRQEIVAHLVAEARAKLPHQPNRRGENLLLLAQASEEPDTTLQMLEMVPATSPAYAEARWRLGQLHLQLNEPWPCYRSMHKALSVAGGFWPARLGLAECLQVAGLEGLALAVAEKLLQNRPDVPEVLEVTASLARNLGEDKLARQLYQKLWSLQHDSVTALGGLYELCQAAGDLDGAVRWLERRSRIAPADVELMLQRVELFLAAKRPQEASRLLERLESLAPWDHRSADLRARLAITQGEHQAAIAALKQALERRPNEPAVASRLRLLSRGQPHRDFYHPWLKNALLLAKAPHQPPVVPNSRVKAGAVRLADTRVVRIHPTGAVSRFRQQILQVVDERGAKRLRTFHIFYVPGRQRLDVLQARVIRSSGAIDHHVLVEDDSLSEPWYNVYYDVHARRLTFPRLVAGDLVEVTTLRTDTGAGGLLDGYFGDLVQVTQLEPTASWDYVLQAPKELPLYSNQPLGRSPQLRQLAGNIKLLHWHFDDLAALEQEPAMPGTFETGNYLHLSTHSSWPELSRWYYQHARDQLIPSRRIKQLAHELTAGVRGPRQKAAVLYRFVSDEIRYVALEFGVHSYLPATAGQVLAQRFGDCKDKSALLVSLLQAVGLPARLLLLRAGSGDFPPPRPASLIPFNHAIVQVPSLGLWLDTTVSHHPAGLLPPAMQGVAALPVNAQGAQLVTSPVSRPGDNLAVIEERVLLGPDGNGAVTAMLELRGYLAPMLRSRLASGRPAEQVLREQLGQMFPTGRLQHVQVLSGAEKPEQPLRVRLQLEVNGITQQLANQHRRVPLLGRTTSYRRLFAPYPMRTHDLLLGIPWQVGWHVCHRWPAGWRLDSQPPQGRLTSPWFTVQLESTPADQGICIQARLIMQGGRVPAKRYAEFRGLLEQLDRLLNGSLVLQGEGTGGGA